MYVSISYSLRSHVSRPHHMFPVVMVGVSVHKESQASKEALDPRDQQVLRGHPVVMEPKDPWAHEE